MKNVKVMGLIMLLAGGLAWSCQKFDRTGGSELPETINAKNYYKQVVQKEKDMLARPYEDIPRNSTRRNFARMAGLSELMKWEAAKTFGQGDQAFMVVPIDGNLHPFSNKQIEGQRFGVFYKETDGQTRFKVMELLSRSGESLLPDLLSAAAQAFKEDQFGGPAGTGNLTAFVNIYDESYSLLKSYQYQAGKRATTSKSLSNRIGRPKNRPVPVIIGRTTCSTCQTYYLIGIWYDIATLEIVDSYIIDSWDECTQTGAPPSGYGPEPEPGIDPLMACHQNGVDAFNDLVNNAVAVSETEGFDITTISSVKKNKNPHWAILRGGSGLWYLRSFEIGEVEFDSYFNRWEWKSLTHDKIDKVGMSNIGGVVEVVSQSGTPSFIAGTPNVLYAGMSLQFTVKYTASPIPCPPFTWIIPPVEVPYTSNNMWDANP